MKHVCAGLVFSCFMCCITIGGLLFERAKNVRAGLRGGGGVGMGVSGMVFVGLVLGCIEAKICK